MSPSAFVRVRDAAVATGRFLGRLGPRGWVTVVALAAFPAAVPVGATVAWGARPPGGITRAVSREAPGVVAALRSVPELAVIPGAIAVVGLVALYVHSVAETALVRRLRGGGDGVVRSLAVGGRLFAVRVGLVVALVAVLAAVGAAVGRIAADPVRFVPTAVAASGPVLVVLTPVALVVDLLTVEVAVPVALADREPERHVDHPDPPESEEWGSATWWRQQMESETGIQPGSGDARRSGGGRGWSSSRDHVGPRGVLSVWGDLWRTATRDPRDFLGALVPRVALEVGVWVATGVAFYVSAVVVALLGLLVVALLAVVVAALDAVWVVVVGFVLAGLLSLGALALLTTLVHVPLRAYSRYYGLFVFGDLDPDLDAVPERRAAFRIRREADRGPGASQATDAGEGGDRNANGDGTTGGDPDDAGNRWSG